MESHATICSLILLCSMTRSSGIFDAIVIYSINEHLYKNILLSLYSCVFLCVPVTSTSCEVLVWNLLKLIFLFFPIPDSKSLSRVNMNTLIQFSTAVSITLDRFMPDGINITDFVLKMLFYETGDLETSKVLDAW